MGLIVTAVVASGVLTSKLLLESGVHALRLRYPVAVLASYGVFLLLVRIWIWYVTLRQPLGVAPNVDLDDIPSSGGGWGGGSSVGAVRFGGGSSGGGGASDLWDENATTQPASVVQAVSGHHGFLPDLDIGGCDDDGWLVLLLLATLVLGIFCAGGYLIYVAPQVLPEAACQVALAPALMRVSKEHHHGWMPGVLQSTVIPFVVVCLIAAALGWAAHNHCPHAARLIDVWNCRLT